MDEAQRVFSLIAESPDLGSPVPRSNPYRRWSLRRFPHHVIYRTDGGTLFVLAVAHDRRRPGYWSKRS
ncbi:type II toxin-antitoxin system RelE/ParE family toxin [Rubrivirga litoralis]|uniref:type II toxin-antitoxin system RelE/ParE family toxin n=1 Tax=Rubrivirga litoralis TaxID=3075598 RepID=UPI003D774CD8